MIDTAKAQWDLTKEEKYAISWFEKNGFDAVLEKQYLSKTVFTVTKDGISDKFELRSDGTKVELLMEWFQHDWELLRENRELREKLKRQLEQC